VEGAAGTIREGDWRRLYARQHPLALVMALGLAVTGVMLTLSPPLLSRTVVAQALPAGLEYPWDLALTFGGIGVLTGFWKLDNRLEAAGCILLAGCLAIWTVVYIAESSAETPVYGVIPIVLAILTSLGYALRGFALTTADRDELPPWSRRR
jgi:peptidoglycan/LPS O-acetylase OafA/YrhL